MTGAVPVDPESWETEDHSPRPKEKRIQPMTRSGMSRRTGLGVVLRGGRVVGRGRCGSGVCCG